VCDPASPEERADALLRLFGSTDDSYGN